MILREIYCSVLSTTLSISLFSSFSRLRNGQCPESLFFVTFQAPFSFAYSSISSCNPIIIAMSFRQYTHMQGIFFAGLKQPRGQVDNVCYPLARVLAGGNVQIHGDSLRGHDAAVRVSQDENLVFLPPDPLQSIARPRLHGPIAPVRAEFRRRWAIQDTVNRVGRDRGWRHPKPTGESRHLERRVWQWASETAF